MNWGAVISRMLLIKFLEYVNLTSFAKRHLHTELVRFPDTCPRISRYCFLPHLLYRSGKSQLIANEISSWFEPLQGLSSSLISRANALDSLKNSFRR